MKKCILTGYDNKILNCSGIAEVIENKKQYSKKYDWDFICKTDDSFDKHRPAAFSKIQFILDCLVKYDVVFWNDFDCIFTNFSIDITHILRDDEYIGVLEQSKNYFCTGNFLIKNNDYTKDFFSSLRDLKSWNNDHHPWEQRCFNEKAQLTNYQHIRRFRVDEFGTFNKEGWWIIRPWQSGDFILHISGGKNDNWQDRINLFLKTYKEQIIYV
jgi:hypothetical protein